MTDLHRHITWLFFLTLLPFVHGQDANYIQYTTKDGLPTNYVYGVVEDEDGYIWAYTENGLAKFDGYEFEHYTVENGLPGNDIPYAECSPDGKIWLYVYKNRPAYLYQDSIHIIYDGRCALSGIWEGMAIYGCSGGYIGYKDSLYHLNINEISAELLQKYPEVFTPVDWTKWRSISSVYSVLPDGSKQWYAANGYRRSYSANYFYFYKKGLLVWKDSLGQWQEMKITASPSSEAHNFRQVPNTNEFLISLQDGDLFWLRPDTKSYTHLSMQQFGISPKAHIDITLQDDFFWLDSDAGALSFDYSGTLIDVVKPKELIEQYFLHRIYKDSNGNLWIGSRDGGLFLIPQSNRGVNRRALPNNKERHFEQLLPFDKGLVIGISANTGIYAIYPDTIVEVLAPDKSRRFRDAVVLPNGILISSSIASFLLTVSGEELLVHDFNTYFDIGLERPESKDFFDSIPSINDLGLNYSRQENALYTIKNSSFIFKYQFQENSRKVSLNISSTGAKLIHIHPSDQTIYTSDLNGLNQLQQGQLKPVLPADKQIQNISSLFGTPGKLWIGTEDKGLFCYDLQREEMEQIASVKVVRRIRPDGQNGILVACNEGVLAVPFDQPGNYSQYTALNGLPTNEIEDVLALNDSIIYVASPNGLHELNRFFKKKRILYSDLLDIKLIKLNQQNSTLEALKDLGYQQNNITFNYSLRSYASNKNITYYTRLLPLEEEWQTSTAREKTYPSLPPGRYTFLLKAVDAYGTEAIHHPVEIYIAKPIWQQFWFQALGFLLLFGSVILLAMRRIVREKKAQEAKRHLEKRMANLELDALKAQMNPHFIFNALGAIQYFIQTHEVDAADNYLTMFARLMRMYLDSAREKMIPLDQEIALLRNYTALEKMRFEGLFDTRIDIQPGLRPENFLIPPMLLQPFVENAVNHGLSERTDGKGMIQINFQTEEERLVCIIRDNGIGRQKATAKARKLHRSRGMKIVQEKVETLRTSGIADIQIDIQEAFPEDAVYPGTEVRITIKNLEHEDA